MIFKCLLLVGLLSGDILQKKYERFLYQTKTWIAPREVLEKWAEKGFWKK